MKISNYAHWVEIIDGEYALFNSILMQIAFVDKEQLVKIKKFDVNNKEKEQLLERLRISETDRFYGTPNTRENRR